MITLITGKPGSGKTLLAIEMILENSKAESVRPCFTNIEGIDNRKLLSFELEKPDEWHLLPEGSMIFIDEVQDWMPPRSSGKAVPEFITMLNKHRHMGFDIVLMTPDPMLVDVVARKTVGRHLHCFRPFGVSHRQIYEWNACNDSPEPAKNQANALTVKKNFDKKLFDLYKSAQIHTHKSRLPYKKLAMLFIMPVLAILFFAFAGMSLWSKAGKSTDTVKDIVEVEQKSDVKFITRNIQLEDVSAVTLRYKGRVGDEVFLTTPDNVFYSFSSLGDYRINGRTIEFLNSDGQIKYKIDDSRVFEFLM